MKRTVSDTEAREQLDELLEAVAKHGAEVVIERDGKPVAVVMPAAKWELLTEGARSRARRFLEQAGVGNEEMTDEEVERLVSEEIEAVRASHRAIVHR